ncbi:MAG: DODA-type extradiol aromatic ring-opening family dioxygenase [Isosphaeraceae bacterium]
MTMTTTRQPTIFLSHGGGPCFWIDIPGANFDGLRDYLSGLLDRLPERPRAILIISGHWEEALPTVSTAQSPPMLFDYYGFPEHTYRLSYKAPGSPALARRVRDLLAKAGVEAAADDRRGFDHGVFVPLLILNPAADIPVVMLSLRDDLDPAFHLAIGRALAPLRDEGVLILGSGNSYHNLQAFWRGQDTASPAFDAWLTQAVTQADQSARERALTAWEDAPFARECHPREEHLLPLMVAVGAAGSDPGVRDFHDVIMGKHISGYRFG